MAISTGADSTVYDYQAIDSSGKIVDGQISAQSQRDAQRVLQARSLLPVTLAPAKPRNAVRRRWFQRKPSVRDDAMLMEQLALLLCAGIPLLSAVASLRNQPHIETHLESLRLVERRLRGGESFTICLEAGFPGLPGYVAQLAAAGEATGRLGQALQDAVAQMKYDLAVRQDMRNSLTYPLILMLAGATAVLFIFIVVVPRFSAMLKGKLDQLPFISRAVIELGVALNEAKLAVFLLALGLLVGGMFLWRDQRVRKKLRELLDRLPLIGEWLLETELARWATMLSTLLLNGVDLIRALHFARETVYLDRLYQRLGNVTKLVRTGKPLSEAISSQEIFTPTAISLIQVGEASGALASLLKSMADLYNNAAQQRMKRFLIMLEPISILFIGTVIGGIVAAIMLAITSVNQVSL